MRLITLLSLAVLSGAGAAQVRPHYGGTLRLELRQRPAAPDEPSAWFASVFETLVRLDDRGEPQPQLAVSWSHDEGRRRWVFTPRRDVRLHNGEAWPPAAASLSFPDDKPIGDLLRDLARPRNAIIVRPPDGPPVGTGPFRIAAWEPGKSITLAANDAHWAGRPFLDSIQILFGRDHRDQSVDLELGRADVIEIPLREVRRLRGAQVDVSPPCLLLAVVAQRPAPALGPAIDRSSIHTVLLQRQGEPTGALLPQMLSGLAFLFPAPRDLDAARKLAAAAPLTFQYDRADPLLRSIAERIILNASEAGLKLRFSGEQNADLRLALLPVSSTDPRTALEDLAAALGLALPAGADLFAAEKALLETNRVIPLFHLPAAFRLSGRVRGWRSSEPWPLADVWVDDSGEAR
jgi:hypothetical protein